MERKKERLKDLKEIPKLNKKEKRFGLMKITEETKTKLLFLGIIFIRLSWKCLIILAGFLEKSLDLFSKSLKKIKELKKSEVTKV